jgi:serine protease Do
MNTLLTSIRQTVGRHLAVGLVALAGLTSIITYELVKPISARAAVPHAAEAAPPLDDNSVNALLSLDRAMEALAAHVTPATVNVSVTSKNKADANDAQIPEEMQRFFGGPGGMGPRMQIIPRQPPIERGIGSGVIISPDGFIVTNNHVVEGAVEIRVTMSNRKVLSAKLIGTDPLTDLAVIKVDATNLPSVPWGDSTQLHPGQSVLAFGNPFGFRFTVTRGIVSALNRPNPSDDRRKPGAFIQTDAAINPGNSGGPLVNARGEVVGINTFLVSGSGTFAGMGFAIPTQIVRPTVEALIKDGKVSHGYIGIGIADVTPENSKFFNLTDASGALVSQVEDGSPGSKAGLKIGDVITEVNGEKVNDAGQLQVIVGQKRPESVVKLALIRDGKTMTLPVTLEAMGARDKGGNEMGESAPGKMRWGIGLSDLTPDVRDQLQGPNDLHGAVVEQVQPGSAADDAGLRRGDVIMQVNRRDMKDASDVKDALAGVAKGQDALILVWSNGGNTFRVMHSPDGM